MSNPEGKNCEKSAPGHGELFRAFFKIGLTAFGGPAMINHIRELVVDRKGWLSETTFKDGIAICQTLPGAIVVNMAAYAGYRCRGISGMLLSFVGFSLPAFGLMVLLSVIYQASRALPAVEAIFSGLGVVVVSIVAYATFTFGQKSLKSLPDYGLAILASLLLLVKLNPFLVILTGGLLGLLLFRLQPGEYLSEDQHRRGSYQDAVILLTLFLLGLGFLWLVRRDLFDLAWVMAKIELFAFGGGYTAITLMFHEVVEVRSWMDNQTLLDGVALGQLTPGPILNTSTFIGFLVSGFAGAVAATLGIFFPGLIMVAAILPIFDRLRSSAFFPRIIRGIIACFVGLLLYVTIKFGAAISWDPKHLALLLIALAALYKKVDLFIVVAGAGLISYFFF
ncbi:MAG: chromate efflux transporter [Desulfobulbaceae bacterium]|nr:chromate efflux transporter [Desulfobulbaceae bacterium]HIJ80036.1 chromate efflux transporter [Deltaproteobacteria bacterium]